MAFDAPPGLRCLVQAYPDKLCGATATELVWCDGTRMAWDDGATPASHGERLNRADLRDQMAQTYPSGAPPLAPPADFDPGRLRHQPFFDRMYGANAAAVRRKVLDVPWLLADGGGVLRVTRVNAVDRRLRAVAAEIATLPKAERQLAAKTAGGFVWRTIRGTDRRSVHSHAIAVDVAMPAASFWGWDKPGPDGKPAWRNKIPMTIVNAFERQGFIWGGRWHHYDTMHFEYRPELFAACAPPK